ncbi:hypothetical protein DFH06DRAFT_1221880 [Mycena polygramma]|nr:hypothetical protein DFH06DRAFT_1221880 [Mycena polygramma]
MRVLKLISRVLSRTPGVDFPRPMPKRIVHFLEYHLDPVEPEAFVSPIDSALQLDRPPSENRALCVNPTESFAALGNSRWHCCYRSCLEAVLVIFGVVPIWRRCRTFAPNELAPSSSSRAEGAPLLACFTVSGDNQIKNHAGWVYGLRGVSGRGELMERRKVDMRKLVKEARPASIRRKGNAPQNFEPAKNQITLFVRGGIVD